MTFIDVELAKNQLAELVERAKAGEKIVISRNGKPEARFEYFRGDWNGPMWETPDLEVPDPEFEAVEYRG